MYLILQQDHLMQEYVHHYLPKSQYIFTVGFQHFCDWHLQKIYTMFCQDKNLEHNICAPLTMICCVNLVFIESTVNLFKQFNVIYFIIKVSVSKLMGKKTEPSWCCLVHTLVSVVFLDSFLRKRERERVAKKIF